MELIFEIIKFLIAFIAGGASVAFYYKRNFKMQKNSIKGDKNFTVTGNGNRVAGHDYTER